MGGRATLCDQISSSMESHIWIKPGTNFQSKQSVIHQWINYVKKRIYIFHANISLTMCITQI